MCVYVITYEPFNTNNGYLEKVNMFSMNKDLSNHIFKDDEIDDSQNDPTLTNNAAVAPDSSVVEDPEISDESDVSSAD